RHGGARTRRPGSYTTGPSSSRTREQRREEATLASDPVLYDREDAIGIVTLNRPDNRNSMTPDLLDAFSEVIARVRAEPELRCVVITGRGSCFSAGADFRSAIQRDGDTRPLQPHERSYAIYEPFLSVLDVEVPVIAAMNGHA